MRRAAIGESRAMEYQTKAGETERARRGVERSVAVVRIDASRKDERSARPSRRYCVTAETSSPSRAPSRPNHSILTSPSPSSPSFCRRSGVSTACGAAGGAGPSARAFAGGAAARRPSRRFPPHPASGRLCLRARVRRVHGVRAGVVDAHRRVTVATRRSRLFARLRLFLAGALEFIA